MYTPKRMLVFLHSSVRVREEQRKSTQEKVMRAEMTDKKNPEVRVKDI